jgi:hypothetical protein
MLYAALEDAEDISASMVVQTAAELDADLQAGQTAVAPPEPAAPSADPALIARLDALEARVTRVDQLLRRLFALASGESSAREP